MSTKIVDEIYNLRGLDMATPDQVVVENKEGQARSPFTINSRMFAREDAQSRVASRTRHGSIRLGTAIGEALSTQNVAAASVGEYAFGPLADGTNRSIAQSFVAGANGALTHLDFELRKASGSYGQIIVRVYSNTAGFPGDLLAASSIPASSITTSQAFLSAYLMDAPTLVSGTTYWIALYAQDNSAGSYFGNQSTGSTGLGSADGGESWTASGGVFRFKTYLSTAAPIKGFTRRYPSDLVNRTLIAYGGSVTSLTDAGVATVLDATLDTDSDFVRFEHIDDKSIWVNGSNNPRWTTDGTPATVVDVPSAPAGATHVIAYQNRVMYVVNKVLVKFTNLYPDITTIDPVNFFYVPNPKSSDPVTAWVQHQNNLLIFTHETKHVVRGSDISTFERDEMKGTKGAVSQEAVAVAPEGVYFMADDKQIYLWNGARDILISDRVQPELQGILDTSSVRLHYIDNQLRIYYHKVPDVANNRMLLWDVVYKEWFMDTGRSVVGSLEWTQDNNELIELSSKVGWMFQGEQGYSDVGKAISYKYWEPYRKYGSGGAKKRIRSFRPVLRVAPANYILSVGVDKDFNNSPDMRAYIVAGGGAIWGQFVWGDGTKWGGRKLVDKKAGASGRGRYIQYRYEADYVEAPVELYGRIAVLKQGTVK